MFSPKLIGAALLAVPLNVAAAQTATSSSSDPASGPDGHAFFSTRTFAWVAGVGASSAAFFAAVATHRADASPSVGTANNVTGPNAPNIPTAPTPVTLPFSGATSPNQNTPSGPPPDTTGTPGTDTSATGDLVLNDLPPNGPIPPQNTSPLGPPPPPPPPPKVDLVVVTTPEPESLALLGTGLIALVPAYRRRRS